MPVLFLIIYCLHDYTASKITFHHGKKLEVISKPRIRLKSKAQTDEKAESAKVLWRMSSTF